MQLAQQADLIHKAIQSKIDALMAVERIPQWRYHQGAAEGAQAPDYDDGTWESVSLMKTWSSADGEAWFRTRLTIPAVVEGIDLAGSRLELEVFLAIGATIYVNGHEMFHEDFWTDSRAVSLVLTE